MSQSPAQHNPSFRDFMHLILLATIWGSSFMLNKIALKDIPPATIVAMRIGLGAVFMLGVMKYKKMILPEDYQSWKFLFLTAFTGMSVPFVLISWAQETVDSNIAAILMSMTPLSTLIVAHYVTDNEKITLPRALGLSVGFLGVVLLFGGMSLEQLKHDGIAQFAIIFATFLYTISNMFLRKVSHLPPITSATGVVLSGAVVSIPFALLVDHPWTLSPSLSSLLAVTFLGIVSSAIAIVIMAALVFRAGAGFMTLNNYIVPVVGLFWGVGLLGEPLTANAILGFSLILLGVATATLWRRKS